MSIILASQETEIRRITGQNQSRQTVCETLSRKYLTQKMAGGMAQEVQCLPSKYEALSSNPSATKRKKNKGAMGMT
jgi:hypothetical protein